MSPCVRVTAHGPRSGLWLRFLKERIAQTTRANLTMYLHAKLLLLVALLAVGWATDSRADKEAGRSAAGPTGWVYSGRC